MQTVGAYQQNVARLQGKRRIREIAGGGVGAHGRGEDVPLRVNGGFFRSKDAVLNHPRYPGMILCELRNAIAANQVEPAIADVSVTKLAIEQSRGGTGGPHAVKLRAAQG